MYSYNCTIVYWHDGDTAVVDIDEGFGNSLRAHIRLYDCWCPELSTTKTPSPAGEAALARVTQLMPPGTVGVIDTKKAPVDQEWKAVQNGQTFARWLGIIYLPGSAVSIGTQLISENLGTRTRNA